MRKALLIIAFLFFINRTLPAQTPVWTKFELSFQSTRTYNNPVYDVKDFRVAFAAPSGRVLTVRGFWDGGTDWKVRFLPDETGTWTWKSDCTDKENSGLHNHEGKFDCMANNSGERIFNEGAVGHEAGNYYLSYNNGTPFFWLACTAWNGALKSTEEEWQTNLNQPGIDKFNEWVSVAKTPDNALIVVYIPSEGMIKLANPGKLTYTAQWFNPVTNKYTKAGTGNGAIMEFLHHSGQDVLLLLNKVVE